MDVSIIIVNYNSTILLLDTIDSIFEKSYGFSFEIIVVDNASLHSPEQILRKKYDASVIYLPLPENIGFGRANNEGAKIAKAKYLFLLNPDTLLINNAIKILLDYIDLHPSVGVVGGNLYSSSMSPNISFVRKPLFPSLFMELCFLSGWIIPKLMYRDNFEFNHTGKPLEVGFIIGADMLIRKDVFQQVDGFDARFFMYAEETDLSKRIYLLGYKSISVPEAKIIHLEGKSNKYKSTQMKMRYEGRMLYYKKYY